MRNDHRGRADQASVSLFALCCGFAGSAEICWSAYDTTTYRTTRTTVGRGAGAVAVLLVLFAACGSSGPTSPTGTNPPSSISAADSAACDSLPSLVWAIAHLPLRSGLSYPVSDFTKQSRFVLYDNGAFVLQYPTLGEVGFVEGIGRERRHPVRVVGPERPRPMGCDWHFQRRFADDSGAGSMMNVRHCIEGLAIELLLDAQSARIEKETRVAIASENDISHFGRFDRELCMPDSARRHRAWTLPNRRCRRLSVPR